jgi:hypothetical protein
MHDHDGAPRLDRMIRERGTDYAALSRVLAVTPRIFTVHQQRSAPPGLP